VTLTVLNPATEEPIAELDQPGIEETDAAVALATAAFPAWRRVAPADRARLLRRLATLVEEHGEELAQVESRNVGKPVSGARAEVGMVAQVFHFYAGAVDKHHGETIPVAGGVAATFREPLGVVGLIVPWNFPLNIASWKLEPALACGNTVVLKPAELTPLSALRLGELCLEAGIPDGVVNVLPGKGSLVGQRLVEHPDVAKIAFTGSTDVGRRVMEGAARTIKRVTLELGGKSANVVFADADLETAAASAPYAVFDNAGQDCCARSRILVQESVYDEFLDRLVEATRHVRVGDPSLEETEMGPLISFRIANDTPYGLSGSIWTRDGARALRVGRAVEAGVLSVNANTSVRVQTPFGGFKQSGFGRELGMHALDGYSEVKSVFLSTGA
jgi:acyl-CoA reductase-like NAD-dependent aldehyde dehydrogenase